MKEAEDFYFEKTFPLFLFLFFGEYWNGSWTKLLKLSCELLGDGFI